MKKSVLFLVFVLSVSTLQSQNWLEFTTFESANPTYNILQSNDTIVKFTVTVPGMFESPVDTFIRVIIKEHTKMDSVGFPEMQVMQIKNKNL